MYRVHTVFIFTVGWLAFYKFFHPKKLTIVLGSTVNLSEVRVILKNKLQSILKS